MSTVSGASDLLSSCSNGPAAIIVSLATCKPSGTVLGST